MLKEEQETIINWNEKEPNVSIYTASERVMRRCVRLGFRLVKTDRMDGKECSWWFEVAPVCVHLRRVPKKPTLTPEQQKAAAERGKWLSSLSKAPRAAKSTQAVSLPGTG